LLLTLLGALSATLVVAPRASLQFMPREANAITATIARDVNRLSALEWRARAERGVSDDVAAETRALREEIDAAWLELARADVRHTNHLADAYDVYQAALSTEFDLLRRGKLDAAEAVDEGLVDPAFGALDDAVEENLVENHEQARVEAADATARTSSHSASPD
jgi:hypothetical protein